MKLFLINIVAGLGLLALSAPPARAADRHTLETRVPAAARLTMLSRLPATNRLQLAIGLPLHHPDGLTNLLHQLYEPGNTNFHRYLTPAQFTAQFGPTEPEYQQVKDYAASNHLEVIGSYGNRALVDVAGSVADIEKMFQIHLGTYQHPSENRVFFGPDGPPTVETNQPISYVVGLDNYVIPKPRVHIQPIGAVGHRSNNDSGSGTNNEYLGKDFRTAYIPGSSLNGAGQVVGLFELDGYTASDITEYESLAKMTTVPPIQNYLCPGKNGVPGTGNGEVCLDIEMVVALAPGLQTVLVVEGYTGVDAMNVLAAPPNGVPFANQISTSWAYSEETTNEYQLMEMAAQGQSFFYASGDSCAPTNGIQSSSGADDNYLTAVGGTELAMTNPGVAWQAESVWHQAVAAGSTGYVETGLPIPEYQKLVNTTANGGSGVYRNVPDVAMCANQIETVSTAVFTNGNPSVPGQLGDSAGTSAAAPLWAAFTALVNQQGAANGQAPVGFLNPALYAVASTANYTNCFHDVVTGNNTNTYSDNLYLAGPGYDNCTGLGTPNGVNLVNALLAWSGPVFVQFGYSGSPQKGSFFQPYGTLAQGTNAVNTGGTIFLINGGSSAPTPVISKPMTITAQGGAATIGN
jgi:subtilase family serine protease